MSHKAVSSLPAASSIADTDHLYGAVGGHSRKVPRDVIGDGLGFQFYDGATVRTMKGKMRDHFNGRDVGMTTDGVDCAAAWLELNEEIGDAIPSRIKIDLPWGQGQIKTTSGLVVSDKFVSMVGGGPAVTSILYSGSGKLFDLARTGTENAFYNFSDFMVDTDQPDGVTAWYIEQTAASGVVGGTDVLRIRNVLAEGQGNGYWRHALWQKNIGGVYLNDFSFINDNDAVAQQDSDTAGIYIDNDDTDTFVIRAFHAKNLYLQRFYRCIRVNAQNSVESVYVSQGELLGRTGVYFGGASGPNRISAFRLEGLHFDNNARCVHAAAKASMGRIVGCDLRISTNGGSAEEAYLVDWETGGESVVVAANNISGNASSNANNVTAVRFGGDFFRAVVGPNTVRNCDVGYAVEDTADDIELIPGEFSEVTTPYSITTSNANSVFKGRSETLNSIEGQYTGDLDSLAGAAEGMSCRRVGSGASNVPSGSTGLGSSVVTIVWDTNSARQIFFHVTGNRVWVRSKNSGTFGSWVEEASLGLEDQTLIGGARVTSKDLGTQSTGTLTPDPGDRPLQHVINGGAFTLAPGSNTGSYMLDIENNGSAGAITTSGWTKVTGDAFTTTNGHKFRCMCSVGQGGSLLAVQALQ